MICFPTFNLGEKMNVLAQVKLGRDGSPNAPFGLNIEVEREAEGASHVESSVLSGSIAKALGTSLSVFILAIVLLAVYSA